MICPKCGTENVVGSSFCIKCGNNLNNPQQTSNVNYSAPINNQQQTYNQNTQTQQQVYQDQTQQTNQNFNGPIYTPPIQNNQASEISQESVNNENVSSVALNYLIYIIAVILKPIECFKQEESKLNNTKTSFVLSIIVAGIMTLINLIKTVIATVRVEKYSFYDGESVTWEWSNLKELKWFEVIGKNFLIYFGIIFAIAVIFYIGSLIIKKNISFIKTLSISATSVIPTIIGMMILSPLAGMIWAQLSIVFTAVGTIYSILILYELMNNELKLENDFKLYFNLICFGILVVGLYYVFMKFFMASSASGLDLDSVFDLLGY
jgi:hypothetical protein